MSSNSKDTLSQSKKGHDFYRFFAFVDNQKNAPKYRPKILSKRHRFLCNRAGNEEQLKGYKSEMTMVIGHRRTENIRLYQIDCVNIQHCLVSMLFGEGNDVKQYLIGFALFESCKTISLNISSHKNIIQVYKWKNTCFKV